MIGVIGITWEQCQATIQCLLFLHSFVLCTKPWPEPLSAPRSAPPTTTAMRRPPSLQVDVPARVDDDPQPTTPATMTSIALTSPTTSTTKLPLSSYKPLQPSLALLFSLMSRRDMFCFFIPAVIVSLISGGVAPFMTIAVGQAFDAFAKFPLSDPTQEDKDKLLRGVGISALTLLALAFAALVLSSITSSLWIATGERNLRALRRRAYHVITNKEMVWFDKKTGSDDSVQAADGEDGPIGAGGMMAQFIKCAHSPTLLMASF